jgi:hypothetical protein
VPLTSAQEQLEHELRIELMAVQTEHFKSQVKWEPWKAMAVAAGAGAGLMAAVIGVLTFTINLLLRSSGHTP